MWWFFALGFLAGIAYLVVGTAVMLRAGRSIDRVLDEWGGDSTAISVGFVLAWPLALVAASVVALWRKRGARADVV